MGPIPTYQDEINEIVKKVEKMVVEHNTTFMTIFNDIDSGIIEKKFAPPVDPFVPISENSLRKMSEEAFKASFPEDTTPIPEGMVCENGVCKMPDKMTYEDFMKKED